MTKRVVLLHGVNAEIDWQDRAGDVLQHHFDSAFLRYPQFQSLWGLLLVVYEPWFAVAAMLSVVVYRWFALDWYVCFITAFLIFAAGAAPFGPRLRRNAAYHTFVKKSGTDFARTPHVIAHSFGTYLLARHLESTSSIKLGNLVLCGSVLPIDYDWHLKIRKGQVRRVRNDWSSSDYVGIVAKMVGWVDKRLGESGRRGMHSGVANVHRLPRPTRVCDKCGHQRPGWEVHDVNCSPIGHSGALTNVAHLRMWWLPYFWGLDSAEHQELLTMCRQWSEAVAAKDHSTMKLLGTQVGSRKWGWTHGKAIFDFLNDELVRRGLNLPAAVVMFQFHRVALRVCAGEVADDASPMIQWLHPDFTVAMVVQAAP